MITLHVNLGTTTLGANTYIECSVYNDSTYDDMQTQFTLNAKRSKVKGQTFTLKYAVITM